jgi:energy-coupling factor transporter ATP-binding protein EcfA2
MAAKVSGIKVAGFRGATVPVEISFDPQKPVALVFGENGTGKSTLADAFDFVCNRKYGSLENYSFGEPARKYIPSLGQEPLAVSVHLTSGNQTWIGSLGSSGPTVQPAGPPDAQILRRQTTLRLIEARPKERFDALRAFIDVPRIEKAEKALREAWNAEKTAFDEAARGLKQAGDALERLWAAEGKPATSAIEWAGSESAKNVASLRTSVQQASDLENGYKDAADAVTGLDRAAAELELAQQARLAAEVRQKAVEAKHTAQSAELLTLLEDAQGFLDHHAPATAACPVCEQDVDSTVLAARLAERIDGMQELAATVSALQAAQRQTTNKQSVADQGRRDLCAKIRELGRRLRDTSLVQVVPLATIWPGEVPFLSGAETSELDESHGRALWSQLTTVRSALKTGLESDRKSLNQHNAVSGHARTLAECDLRAKASERLAGRLKTALDIVSGQRKQYVDEVLAEIAEGVKDLYDKLHPDEEIGGVRLFLKPDAISSLEFDAVFHGVEEVPPHAYYSESHLDTLGICVFLALAKRFKTDQTIVVLDDVLTSVDAAHLKRFMALLHEEAVHFNQVVVLTHYRPWRDQYRWAKGDAANTQVIELGPWTLTGGLNAFDFVADLAALEKALAQVPFDRQVVASKGGIALESLLDFVTLKYRCRLPRNARNEHTLGDLAGGIESKLVVALRSRLPGSGGNDPTEVKLKPLIDKATSYSWVRNSVGCHFNLSGSDVPDPEVKAFGQAVLALANALVCSSCRTLPTRRPSGSYWQCRCIAGGLELHPLVAPGADPSMVDDEG